jgi:LAO/AO transport system kinase
LLAPAAGDELQGVKRGIVELADLLVVNKADGELEAAARRTAADYSNALHIVRPADLWAPRVLLCSALTGTGVPEVWQTIEEHQAIVVANGERDRRRAAQARDWMWSEVTDTMLDRLRRDPGVASLIAALEREVEAGALSPAAAAHRILTSLADG